MQLEQKHQDAAEALADLTPQEAAQLHYARHNARLRAIEDAKEHPLKSGELLPEAEWRAFCAHALDGGGVLENPDLWREAHQALVSGSQAAFWPAFAHLLKSELKRRGNIRPLPHGGVAHQGVA